MNESMPARDTTLLLQRAHINMHSAYVRTRAPTDLCTYAHRRERKWLTPRSGGHGAQSSALAPAATSVGLARCGVLSIDAICARVPQVAARLTLAPRRHKVQHGSGMEAAKIRKTQIAEIGSQMGRVATRGSAGWREKAGVTR